MVRRLVSGEKKEEEMKTLIIPAVTSVMLCSCAVGKYAANAEYPETDTGYVPSGHLEEVFYRPSTSGPRERRMLVYLPEGYYENDGRYPVVYLLHGARGNETSWIIKGHLLRTVDSLTACGAMEKTIIVLPNVNQYDNDGDFGKSRLKNLLESVSDLDGGVESAFPDDVIRLTDTRFRTIPEKYGRAIAGLSAGAFQALYISASFPDMFGYVGLFSPFARTLTRQGPHSAIYSHLRQKLAAQFADPPRLYWIMIGKDDLLYPRIQEFIGLLDRKGYRYDFIVTSGGHDWSNWRNYCTLFLQSLWK